MRNIDKGNLLAEYFGVGTSKGVASFIRWVKQSDFYKTYRATVHKLKMAKSLKYRRLYHYAKDININKAKTMEDCFIIYGRMNHVLKIADPRYYSNPLLIETDGEDKSRIGDIKIKFDGKIKTLDEFSLELGYSFEVKKEYIKSAINEWVNEVDTYIVKPLKKFEDKENFLDARRLFPLSRIVEIIIILLSAFFVIFVRFCSIPELNEIPTNQKGVVIGLFYYLLMVFTLIYFLEVVFIFIYKYFQYRIYRRNLKAISINIDDRVVEVKNNLYEYMLKQITNNSLMDALISKFNSLSELVVPIFYFQKRYAQDKRMQKDNITIEEKISLGFYVILILTFFLLYIFNIGGN